jgi:hypothetical protein
MQLSGKPTISHCIQAVQKKKKKTFGMSQTHSSTLTGVHKSGTHELAISRWQDVTKQFSQIKFIYHTHVYNTR